MIDQFSSYGKRMENEKKHKMSWKSLNGPGKLFSFPMSVCAWPKYLFSADKIELQGFSVSSRQAGTAPHVTLPANQIRT